LTNGPHLPFCLGPAGVLILFCVLVIGVIDGNEAPAFGIEAPAKGRPSNKAEIVRAINPSHNIKAPPSVRIAPFIGLPYLVGIYVQGPNAVEPPSSGFSRFQRNGLSKKIGRVS
jgi:hypothetical protein